MRIFIDGYIFWIQKEGGISRYWSELLLNMADLSEAVEFYLYLRPYSANVLPKRSNLKLLEARTRLPTALYNRVEDAVISRHISKSSPDVFHSTYYTRASCFRIPSVVTVYDTIYELFPECFPAGIDHLFERKREVILNADRIIAISENTKKDLISIYGLPEDGIEVVYGGIDTRKFKPVQDEEMKSSFRREHGLSRPYFLYVGRRAGYKNFQMLLRAFTQCPCRYDFMLVAVGGEPRISPREAQMFEGYNLSDCVKFLERLSMDELILAYGNAHAFVMPSLYEGFGLPVLEAMACGCPVLASDNSSLQEIVGDGGILFDPHNPDSISQALEQAADADTAMALSLKGLRRARLFSWNTAARKTIKVYHDVRNKGD